MQTTFRIYGTNNGEWSCSQYGIGCGGEYEIAQSFYILLARFLRGVPGGFQTGNRDCGVSIDELILDFRTPDVPADLVVTEDLLMSNSGNLLELRRTSGIEYVMSGKMLAKAMYGIFRLFLNMGSNTAYKGYVLFERIGKISFALDGKPFPDWDLAERLAKLEFDDSLLKHSDYSTKWEAHDYKCRMLENLPFMDKEEQRSQLME